MTTSEVSNEQKHCLTEREVYLLRVMAEILLPYVTRYYFCRTDDERTQARQQRMEQINERMKSLVITGD